MNGQGRVAQAPWTARDLVRLLGVVGAGFIVCVVAWAGAANRTQLDDQTSWVSLGVLGLAVAGAGETMWLRHGRRTVREYRARLLGHVSTLTELRAPGVSRAVSQELMAAEGMRHYHRPDCPIATGRGWDPLPRGTQESAGRTPCGICRP